LLSIIINYFVHIDIYKKPSTLNKSNVFTLYFVLGFSNTLYLLLDKAINRIVGGQTPTCVSLFTFSINNSPRFVYCSETRRAAKWNLN